MALHYPGCAAKPLVNALQLGMQGTSLASKKLAGKANMALLPHSNSLLAAVAHKLHSRAICELF